LLLPATLTAPQRDQLSLFHVEFPFAHDLPLVKATLAQGFAFGLCLQRWFPEFNDLAHVSQMFLKNPAVISDDEIRRRQFVESSQSVRHQDTADLLPTPK